MKKNLLIYLMVAGGAFFLQACGDDDGPSVNPIVGEWELESVEIEAANPEFSDVNSNDRDNLYRESSYKIEFNMDNTYERELSFFDGDVEEEGDWEIEGDELELDPEDNTALITDFEILEVTEDDLRIKGETDFFTLLPNFVQQDTITSQAVSDSLFDIYGQRQTLIVTFTFERD